MEENFGTNVLVFDTETKDFAPYIQETAGSLVDIANTRGKWDRCRLLEVAWQIHYSNGYLVVLYSSLVKPEFAFEIHPEAINKHKITKEKALSEGMALNDVLKMFEAALLGRVGLIVGHNVLFDIRVVLAESLRQEQLALVEKLRSIATTCTMAMGNRIHGQNVEFAELFERFFGSSAEGELHRADVDVGATAKIFSHLKRPNRDN